MLDLVMEYGLFLAKAITIVLALLLTLAGIILIGSRARKERQRGHLEVTNLNDQLEEMRETLEIEILDEDLLKKQLKEQEKKEKKEAKEKRKAIKKGEQPEELERKRVFVLDFDGDISASEVESLRQEITAVLTLARPEHDEILLRLESPGGLVHGYGLAASQLARIRDKQIPLTICVDKVAASGGYMMACLADKLLAAPFAVIGSIGVVAQLPNFHRLLKKNDIDYDVYTAGEYKRTLTVLGENTEKGKEKFIEELEDTHELFKEFVAQQRPVVDIAKVATGEVWFGQRALQEKLVDGLMTSDDYLLQACENADVYKVKFEEKHSLQERLAHMAAASSDKVLLRWWQRLHNTRLLSR